MLSFKIYTINVYFNHGFENLIAVCGFPLPKTKQVIYHNGMKIVQCFLAFKNKNYCDKILNQTLNQKQTLSTQW